MRSARWYLVVFSVVVGLIAAEITIRRCAPAFNLSPLWSYHPILGWTQLPGATFAHPVRIAFNSMGFRDREHVLEKPSGTVRILLLGDSMLEAVQVPFEETFYYRLEQQLNALGDDRRYELINLGVGDFGTAQEYLALHHYGARYRPDLIILSVFPLNDLTNNQIRYADCYGSRNDRYRPYFVLRHGMLRQTSVEPWRTFLRRYLKAYGVCERWHDTWMQRREQHGGWPSRKEQRYQRIQQAGWTDLGLYVYALPADYPTYWCEAWDITKALILKTRDESQKYGAAFLAVVIPWEWQLSPDRWAQFIRGDPNRQKFARGREEPERMLSAFFQEHGIDHLIMLPRFAEHPETWAYIDGHLNHEGHRVLAESLFQLCKENGWLDQAAGGRSAKQREPSSHRDAWRGESS